MSGPDSSPNFDWLQRELADELPGSSGSDSSTILADRSEAASSSEETSEQSPGEPAIEEPTQAAAPADPKAGEESSLDDLDHVPDAQLNDSDGTTVIIPNQKLPSHSDWMKKSEEFTGETGTPSARASQPTENPSTEENSSPEASSKSPEESGSATNEDLIGEAPTDASVPTPAADHPESVPEVKSPIWQNPIRAGESFPAVPPLSQGDGTGNSERAATGDDDQQETAIFKSDQVPQLSPKSFGSFSSAEDTIHDDVPVSQSENINAEGQHTEVLSPEDLAKARMAQPDFQPIGTGVVSTASAGGHAKSKSGTSKKSSRKAKAENNHSEGAAETDAPARFSRTFIILASYASAVTILLLAMLMRESNQSGRQQQLESLPDIKSEDADNLTYVPADVALPPGHTLQIGEKQRFGNILVEPLAIIRAPVEFIHYSGDQNRKRPETRPLWKLKVRLTNVSDDQEIAPLDRRLVLRWVTNSSHAEEFTNYFIAQQGADNRDAPVVQLYRLPVASDWDMQGQDLGKTLKPGESYETYLASAEDGLNQLPDDLVWRVQIRKGYSPQGHPVTTIFQVAFKKEQVTG